jgi:hypothetical protein
MRYKNKYKKQLQARLIELVKEWKWLAAEETIKSRIADLDALDPELDKFNDQAEGIEKMLLGLKAEKEKFSDNPPLEFVARLEGAYVVCENFKSRVASLREKFKSMKVETNVVRNLADLKQKEMKAIYSELARIDKEGGE